MAGLTLLPALGLRLIDHAGGTGSAGAAPALTDPMTQGQAVGLTLSDAGDVVLNGLVAAWSDDPYASVGVLIGPVTALDAPAQTLAVTWAGSAPAGTAVRLEVRGLQGSIVMPWSDLAPADGTVDLGWPAAAVQYRLTLLAEDGAGTPVVRDVRLRALDVGEPALVAAQSPVGPSLRVYATRIGLIGRTTANGTVIAPEDRFVALPSRRVLAAKGGRDYEVRVEYKGRSITVPVWDIGPWNVRDNYWDAPTRRDMWNDLPAGRPQAAAAYFEAYNGGRDGFGRRILSPAALDISDAAFADLGMMGGDWVQVTMLWPARA